MAGRGPAPKDPRRRARSDQSAVTVIRFEASPQPSLPDGVDWPDQTRAWWQMWADSPLSETFMESDWSFLLDTALLHAAVWGDGERKLLAELRLRVAKFGATPEDRARLRMQFADADAADGGSRVERAPSRARLGALVAVPTGAQPDALEA
jgi:hypothetical protein